MTRAGIVRTTGALLPQVSLALGGGIRKYGHYTDTGAGNATTDIRPGQIVPVASAEPHVGLQSSWEIDLWGKLREPARVRGRTVPRQRRRHGAGESSLVADVASAYFEMLALDHVRAVLHEALARQQRALEVIRLEKQAGRANELAVQQFEAQLADTRAREREVMQEMVEAENRVNLLLGRFPQPVERAKQLLFAGFPRPLLGGRALRAARESPRHPPGRSSGCGPRKFDVKAARAAFFPNLNITAGVGYQAFNPAFLFTTPESLIYSVLGGLVAPSST